MTERDASYEAWIDFYGIGGLALGSGTWAATAGVTAPPTVTKSEEQVYFGSNSYKLLFPDRGGVEFFTLDAGPGFDTGTFGATTSAEAVINVAPVTDGSTRYSVWVYSPTSFEAQLEITASTGTTVGSVQTIPATTWTEMTLVRTVDYAVPKSSGTTIKLIPASTSASTCYVGLIQVVRDYTGAKAMENVSGGAAGTPENQRGLLSDRQEPTISYGRDSASDLSGVKAGSVDFLLNNYSGVYTPPSRVVDYATRRQVVLRVRTDSGKYTNAYVGMTEDFELDADPDERSVSVTSTDQLSRMEEIDVDTQLYPSIRTGAALKAILDAAEIPYDDEDIDSGGTTLVWWSWHGTAADGVREVVGSEGPPATYMMDGEGKFVFHDRHHRVRASYNPNPVYTVVARASDITDSTKEFQWLKGTKIERGRTTVVNRVTSKGRHARIDDEISVVWTAPEQTYTFEGSKTFTGDVDGGFIDGQEPVKGEFTLADSPGLDDNEMNLSTELRLTDLDPENQDEEVTEPDYVVESGSVYLDDYSTSGSQASITLVAKGKATIRGLQLRGRKVEYEEFSDTTEDLESQARCGVLDKEYDALSASPNDAWAVSQWVMDHNSRSRPRATIELLNSSGDLLDKIVGTDLGQKIHVRAVTDWGIDMDFAVEAVQHQLKQRGKEHRFTIQAEATHPEILVTSQVFTFDGGSSEGFDFGGFGSTTIIDPFTFDDSAFDEANFGDSAAITDEPFILGTSRLDSDAEVWY